MIRIVKATLFPNATASTSYYPERSSHQPSAGQLALDFFKENYAILGLCGAVSHRRAKASIIINCFNG